jgi:predicted DsbA family dithiol-disulfide isomerase
MKILLSVICLLFVSVVSFAQTGEVLATVNNQNLTTADLPDQVASNYSNLPQIIKQQRSDILSQQIADILLEREAKTRNTTVQDLLKTEVGAKIPQPSETQIQAVYDANRDQLGGKTLAEVRPQIVGFLQREPQQKALVEYVERLKTTHKTQIVKDVNAPLLQPTDVLAIVGDKQITDKEFEEKAGQNIYETRMAIYMQVSAVLDQLILSKMLPLEAAALGVQPEKIIAREVTDKMKDYTEEERARLENDLAKRLYQKYNAKILLKEPIPFRRNVAILPFNPSRGNATAPVTVVMFSDFQCSACAGAHPVLQKVLAEYKDKIRFVVRNFPLTSIHDNAYNAALAAAAAHAQGKFFEYTEILYQNQDKLDPASLKKYASDLGLNRQQFDADFDGKKFEANIKKDIEDGNAYGISGTPTIYINGVMVNNLSAEAFRQAIERELKK